MENLKKQIVHVLSDASEQYGETYEQRCVYDNDFDNVAEVIASTLSTQHAKMVEMLERHLYQMKLYKKTYGLGYGLISEIESILSSIKKGGSDDR